MLFQILKRTQKNTANAIKEDLWYICKHLYFREMKSKKLPLLDVAFITIVCATSIKREIALKRTNWWHCKMGSVRFDEVRVKRHLAFASWLDKLIIFPKIIPIKNLSLYFFLRFLVAQSAVRWLLRNLFSKNSIIVQVVQGYGVQYSCTLILLDVSKDNKDRPSVGAKQLKNQELNIQTHIQTNDQKRKMDRQIFC